jgi:Na+-driven multidrug efflux pump
MGLFFFSDQVIGLFTTEDISSPLFSMTRKALLIYMVGFVFIGFNSLLASYFQSVEKIKDAMIVNTLRSIIILIPIALFVPLVLPNEYIWTILPISEFLISISILAFYYKKIFVKTPEISKS